MKKTEEQNESRFQEIIDNFIEQLKCEYKDFSCVISVNDGKQTGTMLYGSLADLMHNVTSIENNKGYVKAKEMKKIIEEFQD